MTAPVIPLPKPAEPATPSPAASPPATPTSPPAPAAPASPFAKLSDAEKERLLSVYSGTIRDQNAQLQELGERVKKVEGKQNAPPAVDPKAANAAFYDRPMEMVTDIVRREVTAAIEPLANFVRTAGARDEYTTIKDELKHDPKVKQVFDTAERHIDDFIRKQAASGAKVTRDLVIAAVAGVRGAQELGWIESGNGAPAPVAPAAPSPAPGPSMITPPHLRPSAPPAPGPNDPQPRLRDLNEQEERL